MSRAAMGAALALLASCGGGRSEMPGSSTEPLEPPSDVHAEPGAGWYQCLLAWTPPAQEVDGYEITTDAPGWSFDDADNHGGIAPRGAQVVLDFSNAGVGELSSIEIQIRARNHGEVSAFAPPVTCRLPAFAPALDSPVIEPNGIAVSWENYSSVSTAIEVERATLDARGTPGAWSSIATLPMPEREQHVFDADPHLAGTAYAYRVSSIARGGIRVTSAIAASLPIGAALTTSTVTLPPAFVTVVDRAGHYGQYRARDGRYAWGDGTTWTSSPAIEATTYAPFVKLDAQGLPHAVYGKRTASAFEVDITHGWSDGAAWHEEKIATRFVGSLSSTPSLTFELDATGAPVAMWLVGGVNTTSEIAFKSGGNWVVQPLSALTVDDRVFGDYTVFTDASGVTHVIASTARGLRHLQLAQGAWSDERVPEFSGFEQILGVGRSPSQLVVCFREASFFRRQPRCIRKTSAGWSMPELLGALPAGSPYDSIGWIAMSDDGQRLAVLYQSFGSQLFRSDAPGVWNEVAFPRSGEPGYEPLQHLDFDANGKLFILVDPTAGTSTSETVAYERRAEP